MPKISEETVQKATGKGWKEWFKILDKEGARKMEHKEIARLLHDKKYITSSWWCQSVTVEYEKARGKRVLGETADAGFEIGVTKTLPVSKKQAWDLLVSPAGRKLWLGVTSGFSLKKGETYKTEEGATSEIRTLKPGERIRLTWQPKNRKSPTILQVTVTTRQTTNGTCIGFHQEKLASAAERERMKKHWQKVLKQLEELI